MYNKLFTRILDSSVWLEPTSTRIVWITLLAAMDEDGYCALSAPGNVRRASRVTLDEAVAALDTLQAPDPNSSDPDLEGRRIERVPGGWIVLNAVKYRATATREQERTKAKERQRKHRAQSAQDGSDDTPRHALVTPVSRPITDNHVLVTTSYTDTYTDTEAKNISSGAKNAPDSSNCVPQPDNSATDDDQKQVVNDNPEPAEKQKLELIPTTEKPSKKDFKAQAVNQIWDLYLQWMAEEGFPRRIDYVFTQKRKQMAMARLQESLSITKGDEQRAYEMMQWAILGTLNDDWMMGRKRKQDAGTKPYCDWEIIFGSETRYQKALARWHEQDVNDPTYKPENDWTVLGV